MINAQADSSTSCVLRLAGGPACSSPCAVHSRCCSRPSPRPRTVRPPARAAAQHTAHRSAPPPSPIAAAHLRAGYHRRAARSERRLRELHVQLRPHLHVVGLEGGAVYNEGGGRWRRPCRGGPGCAFVSCCPPLPLPLPVPLLRLPLLLPPRVPRARVCDGVRAWFHRATTRCRSPATSP